MATTSLLCAAVALEHADHHGVRPGLTRPRAGKRLGGPSASAQGHAMAAPGCSRKGVLVAVTDIRGDHRQGFIGAGQPVLGPRPPEAGHVLRGRHADDAAELRREAGPRQACDHARSA